MCWPAARALSGGGVRTPGTTVPVAGKDLGCSRTSGRGDSDGRRSGRDAGSGRRSGRRTSTELHNSAASTAPNNHRTRPAHPRTGLRCRPLGFSTISSCLCQVGIEPWPGGANTGPGRLHFLCHLLCAARVGVIGSGFVRHPKRRFPPRRHVGVRSAAAKGPVWVDQRPHGQRASPGPGPPPLL